MGKSLEHEAAMGNKAQEMLGIGGNKPSQVFQLQRQGFLQKKSFSKSRSLRRQSWQKRYFILKDSFLFWYASKPKDAFDCSPSGCFPLGGCSVFPMGKDKDSGFVFEVLHQDHDCNILLLMSNDKTEVDDWIKILQDCSKATWQNAMMGNALIQKIQHVEYANEKEMNAALNEARMQTEEYQEIRKKKLSLMEHQFEGHRRMEMELLQEKEAAQALEQKMQTKDAALDRERREQEKESQRAERVQQKLENAHKAIEQLEKALERRQRTDSEGNMHKLELQDHIDTIKQFMGSRQ